MPVRSVVAVLVAVMVVGSLASCTKTDSGSDESMSDSTERAVSSTTADGGASSDGDGGSGVGNATDLLGDCTQAAILYSSMLTSTSQFMAGVTDEQIEELEQQADELKNSVPEDLRDDMQTVADAYQEFAEAFASGGFTDPKVQESLLALESGEVRTASDNINAYFADCDN